MMFMMNDMPPVEPSDALEHCIEFKTTRQFKSADWIAQRTAELKDRVKNGEDANILLELQKYAEGDAKIKEKCTSVEWCNAFIHLILKHYKETELMTSTSNLDGESGEGLTAKILSHFKITRNYTDEGHRITNKNLVGYHSCLEFSDSYKKFRAELIGLGCQEYKDKNGTRGLKGLQYIPSESTPEATHENGGGIPTLGMLK
jgi:hypothetical protein